MKKAVDFIQRYEMLSTVIIIVGVWIAYILRFVIVLVFVSYIVTATFMPLVTILRKKKIPKVLAVLTPYFITIIVLIGFVIPIIPVLLEQGNLFIQNFPDYIGRALTLLPLSVNFGALTEFFTARLGSFSENIFSFTMGFIEALLFFLSILIISFYMIYDYEVIKTWILRLTSDLNRKDTIEHTLRIAELKLGAWFRGQLILSLFVGALNWLGYTVIGLPYALPLALIAGVLELIPTIGPILGAIPALIIAITVSPTLFLLTLFVYMGVQILESNVLVPKVMQRVIGVHPIIIILSVIIGGKLMGITGALLSIPLVSLIGVIVEMREQKVNDAHPS